MQLFPYFFLAASTAFFKLPTLVQAAPISLAQYDSSIAIPNVNELVLQAAASKLTDKQVSHLVRRFPSPATVNVGVQTISEQNSGPQTDAEAQAAVDPAAAETHQLDAATVKKHPIAFLKALVTKFKNSFEWVKTSDGYKWMQRAGSKITGALKAAWQWFQRAILRKPQATIPPPPPPEPIVLTTPEQAARYIKIAEDNMRIAAEAEREMQEEEDARYAQASYAYRHGYNGKTPPPWIPPLPSIDPGADLSYPNGRRPTAEDYIHLFRPKVSAVDDFFLRNFFDFGQYRWEAENFANVQALSRGWPEITDEHILDHWNWWDRFKVRLIWPKAGLPS